MIASVVVPVYNGEKTLEECLRALKRQTVSRSLYEIIVVDDGSSDSSADIAERLGVRLIRQPNLGPAGARNAGWRAAEGTWVAFTDADCVPTRTWLNRLLRSVTKNPAHRPVLGAAGKTLGYASNTPAARFVDLIGSFDAELHLSHPKFPFAPSGNVLYRRASLQAVDGFDQRYVAYEACDLHQRLMKLPENDFYFVPSAVIFHRHRADWKAYWRQQFCYGVGFAQFMLGHSGDVRWTFRDELLMSLSIVKLALLACLPAGTDTSLVRRGLLIKTFAQHLGFLSARVSSRERRRWQHA